MNKKQKYLGNYFKYANSTYQIVDSDEERQEVYEPKTGPLNHGTYYASIAPLTFVMTSSFFSNILYRKK